MTINLIGPGKTSTANLIADAGLLYGPLDPKNGYKQFTKATLPFANSPYLPIQLAPSALPPTLTQIVPYNSGTNTYTSYAPVTVSAAFEINSVSGGFLLPRMTLEDREALTATNGMQIYNLTDQSLDTFIGGQWVQFAEEAGQGNVIGPAGAGAGNVAIFGDDTGLLLADSGLTVQVQALTKSVAPIQLGNVGYLQFASDQGPGVYVDSDNAFGLFINGDLATTVFTGGLPSVSGPSSVSALVELQSTTGVLLLSRLTLTELDGLSALTPGMIAYDSTNHVLRSYQGATPSWQQFGTVTSVSGSGFITTNQTGGAPITATGSLTLNNSTAQTLLGFASSTGAPTNVLIDNTTIVWGENNTLSAVATDVGVVTIENLDGTLTISPNTGNVVAHISSTYPGQSSITTVGTVTAGVWNGSVIPVTHGGTGQTGFGELQLLISGTGGTGGFQTVGAGTPGQVLVSNGADVAPSWGAAGGNGTVTSVATQQFITTLSGQPITSTGTLILNNSTVKTLLGYDINTGAPTNITVDGTTIVWSESNVLSAVAAAGGVVSVGNTDGTLTISPTSGSVIASISASYAGQSSITTVGTITSGTWNGAAVSVAHGGTGGTNFAITQLLAGNAAGEFQSVTAGSSGQLLQSNGPGTLPSWVNPSAAGVTSITGGVGITCSPTVGAVVVALNNTGVGIGPYSIPINLVVNAQGQITAMNNGGYIDNYNSSNQSIYFGYQAGLALNIPLNVPQNIAIGPSALGSIGNFFGSSTARGTRNIAIGANALSQLGSNNSGALSNINGNSNIAIGCGAMYSLAQNGSQQAGDGYNNIAIGDQCFYWLLNTTNANPLSYGNVGLGGGGCGQTFSSGNNNTIVGYAAYASPVASTNRNFVSIFGSGASLTGAASTGTGTVTVIGSNATCSVDNACVLGNQQYVGIGTSAPAYTLDLGNVASRCAIRLAASTDAITTPTNTNDFVIYNAAGAPTYIDTTAATYIMASFASFTAGTFAFPSVQVNAKGQITLVSEGTDGGVGGNFFIGKTAGNGTLLGIDNTAVGYNALHSLSNNSGGNNTALGYNVANSMTAGNSNVFIGKDVAPALTTNVGNTSSNVVIGATTGTLATTLLNTVVVGQGAAVSQTSYINSVYIGVGADATGSYSNSVGIGYNASVGANNSIVLGNGCNVGIGTSTPAASLHVVGGQIVNRTPLLQAATPYTVLVTDYIIAITTLTSAFSVVLPAAASANNGQVYYVKDEAGTAATHNITVTVTGGGTIDGASTSVISANYGATHYYSNGTNWFTV